MPRHPDFTSSKHYATIYSKRFDDLLYTDSFSMSLECKGSATAVEKTGRKFCSNETIHFKNGLFRVVCEEAFTTETESGRAATKKLNITRSTRRAGRKKTFFKPRCPLCYPIFVSFATFVVLKFFVEWRIP
jgi:hypothetical protein